MKKKYIIDIPTWGSYHFEGTPEELEKELLLIKQKRPDVARQITVRDDVPVKYSDTEIKAMEGQ